MTLKVQQSLVKLYCLLLLALFAVIPILAKKHSHDDKKDHISKDSTKENVKPFTKFPVYFEENKGQTNPTFKFLSRNSGYNLFLSEKEVIYQLQNLDCKLPIKKVLKANNRSNLQDQISRTCPLETITMKFVGASDNSLIEGSNLLPTKTNYFIGSDKSKWQTDVQAFQSVRYSKIYEGINAVFKGNEEQELEYDFHLNPNADPSQIKLEFTGAAKLKINRDGELVLKYKGGEIRHKQPVAYQIINGEKRFVAARFRLLSKNLVGFALGEYDRTEELVIDPIVYATYLGGSSVDSSDDVALDSAGNIYVASHVRSGDFLHTETPGPDRLNGGDIAVTKFNPSGSTVLYNTYIGGSLSEVAYAIDVDANGKAFIAGQTDSTNFPMINARQTSHGINTKPDGLEGFVTKLNASGAIEYSTYHGNPNNGDDWVDSIAVDSAGNAYVSGATSGVGFPVMNAYQNVVKGPYDGYLSKLSPSGQLLYSTLFGGVGGSYPNTNANDVTVDDQGNAYVAGATSATQLPVSSGAYRTSGGGYVAKFDTTKTGSQSLVYATYISGVGKAIGKDAQNNVYVASLKNGSPNDYKIIKLNSTGTADLYAYQITDTNFNLDDIAVSANGNAYFAQRFLFVDRLEVKGLSNGGSLIGKISINESVLSAGGIAVDANDYVYVAGSTYSRSFPVTSDAFQKQNRNSNSTPRQGFLAKVSFEPGMPLIFIPGVGGSTLFEADANNNPIENLWADGLKQILNPYAKGKLNKLSLNPIYEPFPNIVPDDALRNIQIETPLGGYEIKNIYGSFLKNIADDGNYTEMKRCSTSYSGKKPTLFIFPYDWRLSNKDAADELEHLVDCVRQIHPGKKVNILTHSMGGLVARRYIIQNMNDHHVDKLVTTVAPWIGAPKAIDVLFTGRFIPLPRDVYYIHKDETKEIVRFGAGPHELLPSAWYFINGGKPLAYKSLFNTNYEEYSYTQAYDFINDEFPIEPPYRNSAIFHHDEPRQDNWANDTSGVKYYHLYGQQNDPETIGTVRLTPDIRYPLPIDNGKRYRLSHIKVHGDGTVPVQSANRPDPMLAPNTETIAYVSQSNDPNNEKNYEHNGILNNPQFLRDILAILNNESLPQALAQENNSQVNNPQLINYLSVTGVDRLNITDEQGNTNSPLGAVDIAVPEVSYEYGSSAGESLVVPHEVGFSFGKIVDVKFQTTSEKIAIENLKGYDRENAVEAHKYLDLQLPVGITAWLKFSNNGLDSLRYDANGDGVFETTIQPTFHLTGTAANDRTPPNIDVSFATNNTVATVTVNATDNQTGINKIRYLVQGEASDHVYSSPFTIDLTQSKLIYVSAEDNAGNRNLLAKWIDLVPPTSTTVLTPAANSTGWNNSNITVELKSLDDLGGSGVKSLTYNATGAQTIPEETINKKEAPFTFPQPSTSSNFLSKSLNFSTEGVSTLNFFGKDFAGNTEANKTRVIKIDKTLPVTTHSLSVNGSDVTFTLTASDVLSGVSEIYYTIDGGGAQVYTSPFTVSNNSNHTITYYAKDNAGNIESPRTLFNISGAVTYGTTPANQPAKFVPGVQMTAAGTSSAPATTNLTGTYQLQYLASGGQYTVTPSKSGDINGISPFDATLILQCVAAGTTNCTLTANQKLAADTNGSGDISPFDATLILRFVAAGGPVPGGYTGNVGNWKFLPASRTYSDLNSSLSNEDYTLFLIGEVNGSWTPDSFALIINQQNSTTNTIQISLPQNATAVKDSNISIPVSFSKSDSNVTVRSYSFQATFDPLVLQPQYAGINTSGSLSQGCSLTTNIATPGKIGVASSCPISTASGTLINLYFKVVGEANTSTGTTPLTFLTVSEDTPTPWFEDTNNNPISTGVTGGQFTVTPPAAANSDDSILIEKSKSSSEGVAVSAKAFVSESAQQQQQQQPGAEGEIQISLPQNIAVTQGSVVTIPVTLTNSGGTQLSAYSFDVQFNPALLKAVGIIDTSGTLSSNCFVEANTVTPGRINIAGSCSNSISASSGTLVNLRFAVTRQANNAASEARILRFWQAPAFEDNTGKQILVRRINGSIQ